MGKRKSWIASLLILHGWSSSANAHEKWFYQGPEPPLRWDLFFRPLPIGFLAGVLVITLAAWIVWRMRGRRDLLPGPEALGAEPERRMAFYGLVPAILGLHMAVPLLVNALQGQLFSPNNELEGAWRYWLGLIQTGIALSFFYGGFARFAAVALAALWLIGIGVEGLEPMLENIHYLGFAGFFFLAGRGPIAIDRLLFPRFEPPARLMEWALPALRAGIGLSLIIVGFTEKLANIPLATAFLEQYPLINFTESLGIPMTDELFAVCAGSVEVLAGLLILLNIFPRAIILVAWLPLNLSLTVFNWKELAGHMPFYGALAVLLVWSGSLEDRRLWVSGLREGPLAARECE